MLSSVNANGSAQDGSLTNEIVREGARRMLAAALEAEVNAFIAELADQRDENGRRLVVRNGYHQPRSVTTAAGAVKVKAPRLTDKRVDETRLTSGLTASSYASRLHRADARPGGRS
ncbi:Transposase, Mutator family [Streptomyces sp. PAN_FS17]|nr:Transposase, Mutator family [Streptomyces sp. PAN_FS17]